MTPSVKLREFFSVWNRFARTAAQREDRLQWCARQLGRAIDSMNELSEDDLVMLVKELRREMGKGSRVLKFPKGGQADGGASPEQLWKIRQLEHRLGWARVPERLSGFLREKYHVESMNQLSARDAWRVIEALFGIAAAGTKGAAKRERVKQLKEELRTWRPTTPTKPAA